MKKILLGITLCFLLLLIGCSLNPKQPETAQETSHNESQAHPIDTKYNDAIEKGEEPNSAIVQNYRDEWRAEYEKNVAKIPQTFSAEDAQKLCEILTNWEENLKATWQWENEHFFAFDRSKYGTDVYENEIKAMGDEYRAKALWLQEIISIKDTEPKTNP